MATHLTCRYLGSLLIFGLIVLAGGLTPSAAQDQPDKIDVQRAERYVQRLRELQQSRDEIRSRAAALMSQNPALEQEFQNAIRTQLVSAGALEATPKFVATPSILQGYQAYRGNHGELILQPQQLIWYTLQDNTLIRQQLFLSLVNAQRDADVTYTTLLSTKVALEQVAQHADENFLKFRRLSDLMGRRSAVEITAGETATGGWVKDDPLHAGASLLQAYALRSTGRFDECVLLMETLDNNYPLMESIAGTLKAQIAFLKSDVGEAKNLLDKALAQSQNSGSAEAAIMYGWLMMAEKRWDKAVGYATKARQLHSDSIEAAILEGLATAYERPSRARDGLQALRRGQLNASPDDWQYHEALAIVHQMARDRQFAKKEMSQALAVAPAFMRPELEREQAELLAGNVPQIDWSARLRLLLVR